jgi:asparagine synthase (glutamine-hydrolysing)
MCGIVGYSDSLERTRAASNAGTRIGEARHAALCAARDAIAHRGPDDVGLFEDAVAGIGLAHTRLSILDLSPLGHQPMVSEDGSVVLSYNGELYNFRQLRSSLEAGGARFRSQSDTEVLLALYLRDGEAMLEKLNGIFAFAIWDARRQEMFLARDALGVKPLYYSETSAGFLFASEIKALLPLLDAGRQLDSLALHRYLSFLWCPGEGTPLRNVRKLSPGEAIKVRGGRVTRRWTWYQLPPFRGVGADLSEAEALAGTVEGLRRAVQLQLVADVPVGAFLSGGLDSSSVVALARERAPDIRCFTIESVSGQESDNADDLPYARRVAQHLSVPLEIVRIESSRMADDLERMVVQLDEPLADPAPLNVLYISQLAREQGVKVLLSGAGGDDLFAGYRRHLALRYEPYWRWLPARVRRGLERCTSGLDQRNSLFRRLAKSLNGASLEGDAHLAAYFAWAREEDLLSLYSPEFRADLGTAFAAQPMLDFLEPLPAKVRPLERMLALEQRFFLSDHNLTYTDKMSMAAGVEVRVPFLDLDLVEHAARIPTGLKQRGHIGKWVLKKAMEPYLPKDVIYRPKTGFGAPLRRWLRHELRPLVDEMLSADTIRRRGLFDAAAVARLVQADREGRIDAAYSIFAVACVEIWCRNFLDQRL